MGLRARVNCLHDWSFLALQIVCTNESVPNSVHMWYDRIYVQMWHYVCHTDTTKSFFHFVVRMYFDISNLVVFNTLASRE